MADITITVGAVTATRTYADDQKAAAALDGYADAEGIDPDLPAQERLGAVIEQLVAYIVERARNQHIAEAAQTARGEAQNIGME